MTQILTMEAKNQTKILAEIKQQIDKSCFNYPISNQEEWEVANVIIVSSSQSTHTDKIVVKTHYALALSWLFIQLRDQTFLPELIEENEFYGKLALAANNYLFSEASAADDVNPQNLLLSVLEKAERMFDEYQVEVFVYGTLVTGGSNHQLMKSAEFLGEDAIGNAELVNLGTHPMLIPGKGVVYGERYRVSLRTVEVLDRLEGHPHYYRRRWAYLKSGHQALIYEGNTARTKGHPRILDGRWLSALASNQTQTNREETFVTPSTYEFLSSLRSLDIKLFVDGEKLRCNAPKGVLTPTLQREITERKVEILALLSRANAATSSDLPPILPVSRQVDLPLSFAQERIWFLERLKPGSAAYNMPRAYRLTGSLKVIALEQSLSEIVRRHEILRTTFLVVDGQPSQAITLDLIFTLPIVNLREIPTEQREAEVQRQITQDVQQPFDLAVGPLWRVKLLHLDEAEHVLVLTMHHIISDGWSYSVFFRELTVLYKAFSAGNNLSLPELPIQYADFAHWQRQWLQGRVLESQLDYWKQQLSGSIPALQLPVDQLQPSLQTYQSARQSLELPRNLTHALNALSRREGVTLFMTLLAAFKTLLLRYTGQEDIILCVPVSGRNQAEVEGLIGYFTNILLIRTDLSGNPSFRELLDRVRQVVLGAYEHQDVPFQKLADLPNLVRTPLSRGMFALENTPGLLQELSGITVSSLDVSNETANFDLSLSMLEQGETLTAWLEYKTDLFNFDTIAQMLENFQTLLESIVVNSEQRLSDLPLLTASKRYMLSNDTRVDYSGSDSEATYTPPQTEVERTITKVWQELLHVEKVGIHDNFFDLGAHSLLMAQLLGKLQEVIDRNLSMIELFKYPTINLLASYLTHSQVEAPSFQKIHNRAKKQKEARNLKKANYNSMKNRNN